MQWHVAESRRFTLVPMPLISLMLSQSGDLPGSVTAGIDASKPFFGSSVAHAPNLHTPAQCARRRVRPALVMDVLLACTAAFGARIMSEITGEAAPIDQSALLRSRRSSGQRWRRPTTSSARSPTVSPRWHV